MKSVVNAILFSNSSGLGKGYLPIFRILRGPSCSVTGFEVHYNHDRLMELSPHFLKDLSYALLLLSQIMIDTVHYSAKSTVS